MGKKTAVCGAAGGYAAFVRKTRKIRFVGTEGSGPLMALAIQ
jgi:hypothetical protein